MNFKYLFISVLLVLTDIANADIPEQKNSSMTFYQVMQRVLERYPSLKIAEMEVEQAIEQKREIESALGWILNSTVGITHDLTGIGTPSDRLDLSSSINRQLKSGATLSLSGGYRYEDSSLSFSPVLPNPAHTTRLDLSYRVPLSQGNGNPVYAEGIVIAEASYELAKANLSLLRISLTEQVKEIFYSFLLLHKRIENAKGTVKHTKKLSLFIKKNINLGLSERKDRLQIKAQLDSKLAELSAIQLQWSQLKNSLNRLMLEKWASNIQPIFLSNISIKPSKVDALIITTKAYHPIIKIAHAKLDIAQSQINSAKDIKKDNVDLVMSVGTRTSNGENTTSTVSEQDWAGAVSIQYKHLFDDSGVTSKYKKALIEKNIAIQDIQKTNNDIYYTVSGMTSEIALAKLAVKKSYQRLKSESLKLKEAEVRFRTGRVDTAQLIQFQNELSFAELNYQTQKVDLNKRIIELQIYSGQFWDELHNHNGIIK